MRQQQHHFSGISDTEQLEPPLKEYEARVTTVQNQKHLQMVKGMKVTRDQRTISEAKQMQHKVLRSVYHKIH